MALSAPSVSNSRFLFWKPPYDYLVPEAPQGHTYVPLKQSFFSATYSADFQSFGALSQQISQSSFLSVINSANFVIKSPMNKYSIVRILATVLFGVYALYGVLSLISNPINIIGGIYYFVMALIQVLLIKLAGKQYLERLRNYNKVMKKALDAQNSVVLAQNGILAEPGDRCNWIDFYQGVYQPPPVQQGYYPNPQYPGGYIGGNNVYMAQPVYNT